jgi:hypothetical protein
VAAAAALLLAGCGSADKPATGIDANRFVATVDNPWFPLIPGSVYRYRGVKDGEPSREVMTVTYVKKKILGVPATAVRDDLYLSGRLEEQTTDWYAQERDGTVWYFGEDTRELDRRGRTKSTSGTWQAGKDGAKPGVFMPAHPRVGQSFRQEYLKGQAEDHFAVVTLGATVKVPAASSTSALRTREWTPLEPDVIDAKWYVRGIGTVLERTLKGGDERNTLVSFKRG